MPATHRILIVDDESRPRDAFAALIGLDPDFVVAAKADSAQSALEYLDTMPVDIVVTDMAMPGPNGIQLTKAIRATHPQVRVLMLSSHDESLFAESALLAGASGYLMKGDAAELLAEALRHVASAGIYLSESMWSRLYRPPRGACLSDQEEAFLFALGRGNPPTRALASRLHKSEGFIEALSHRLMRKLGYLGPTELRLHAHRRQMVDAC
ncbi:MAG: DNA-binding NarL/FixJ family response regulator [Myxococcota bacterium]